MSLALFEYHRGNYSEAVNWGNRCLSFNQDTRKERVACAQAILAMSYHQLGQTEQSRSALVKSRELIEERWKTPFTVNEDSRGWWYDWFLARFLERVHHRQSSKRIGVSRTSKVSDVFIRTRSETYHIARPRLIYSFTLLTEKFVRGRKTHRFPGAGVRHHHIAFELARADSHERDTIAMLRIHVRLDLENESREFRGRHSDLSRR